MLAKLTSIILCLVLIESLGMLIWAFYLDGDNPLVKRYSMFDWWGWTMILIIAVA